MARLNRPQISAEVGYYGKLPAEMDPPQHDDWWSGDFDLSSVFSKYCEDALDVMTEGEFENSQLQLADEGGEPQWSEVHYPKIPFFSSSFNLFLSKEGKDPYHHPKEYLMFYLIDNGGLEGVEDVKDVCWTELAILLGGKYHRQTESWNNCIAALARSILEVSNVEAGAALGGDEEEQRRQETGVEDKDADGEEEEDDDGDDSDDKGGQGDSMDVDKATQNQDHKLKGPL
ncbi:hypothetical protein M378DRAFT_182026 [Amanita muscaria Koide BX008]|uniref:Uncharacterized protein n=1 Tax=Amanita muscaria (strain Koide BX008) TaxID=946122 RepID=A0A0C2WHV4_AMAMK|nr:hypothetical protein M378DRAFT_182026 [Amanita muscaria Koide BX008]